MEKGKDFNEWRAKQLGYVYFSRLNDLIISESNPDNSLFDYLIDIGQNGKQTGRLFAVEVRALNETTINIQSIARQYKNISFPLVLVVFDTRTDQGYFTWIKEPEKYNRPLLNYTANTLSKLDNSSLNRIVQQVKDWYVYQSIPLG
jgi:hypothetical protein